MGLLIFPSVWVHLLMFSSLGILCAGDDRRLLPGNPISINQILTSSDGTFALGFFSPENSTTRRYAGIWYNNLPGRTVVWVANREAPLEDAAGVLAVTADGNIALLDGDGTAVWSTNLSGIPTNTSAVLLDSGNLVLADAAGDGGGGYLWQSFDNPTDHYLPTMQLRLDLKTGRGLRLVAWRDPQDPSPGRFSLGIDPRSPLQVVLREGSRIRWRGWPWTARQTDGFRDDSGSSMLVVYSAADEEGVRASYAGTGAFALSRYVLRPIGEIDVLYWNHRASNWSLIGSLPDGPCEIYEPCGPFGYCELDGPSALCRCLQGFEPKDEKDWAVGNFSGGCVRRLPLALDRTDVFLKSDAMKPPDKFSVNWNVSAGQCEAACLEHRRCTAYAFANLSGGDSVGSRCLLWDGELVDLVRRVNLGEDLFVRVAASELGPYVQRAKSSSKDRTLVLVLFPSLATGVLLLGIFGCFLKRRIKKQGKRKNNEQVLVSDLDVSNTLTDITQLPLIDFSTVMAATNNFSAANKLGEGGFGPVYKGILQTGHEIAIKRLSKGSGQGQEEFKNEVALIAKLQHRNLVRLLGYCIHDDERILIYEHMCNNSLDHFLFDATRQAQLHWAMRFNIIKGIARGLLYLHEDSRFKIVHRDLKASNILLDEGMNPKISDFGMARIFGGGQHEGRTNRVVGTFGYMSPEYAMRGLFSMKSDVYSFGVLLLEIINGRRNNSFYHNEVFINLLSYAWQLWTEDKVMEFLDASIAQTCSLVEVSRCMLVGLLCVQDRVIERPSMSSIVFMLENHTPIYGTPKRPMFMLDRGLWRGELPSNNLEFISVSNLTITRIEGR